MGGLPVASGCDKIEEGMDTIITEPWVTLDTRLFGEDVIILALEVSNNLGETMCDQSVLVLRSTNAVPNLASLSI